MAERTITAANSVYMLSVLPIFPVPQRLQGFTADAAFDTEDAEAAETPLGVDGHMSIGWLPTLTQQTISIMPDSPTSDMFEAWDAANTSQREHYIANATVILPGSQRTYVLTRGVLSRIARIPGVRRVLQGRAYRITWNTIIAAPYIPSV